ncbi:MAG: hypothetical protein OHK0018_12930 [Erythrobacter tepidarius]
MPGRPARAVLLLAPLLAQGVSASFAARTATMACVPADVPAIGNLRVVPVRPGDRRCLRQDCIDEALQQKCAGASSLLWRSIGLNCSQY